MFAQCCCTYKSSIDFLSPHSIAFVSKGGGERERENLDQILKHPSTSSPSGRKNFLRSQSKIDARQEEASPMMWDLLSMRSIIVDWWIIDRLLHSFLKNLEKRESDSNWSLLFSSADAMRREMTSLLVVFNDQVNTLPPPPIPICWKSTRFI